MCGLMHLFEHSGHDTQTVIQSAPANESPLDILRRRYALGEITAQQFEEMKQTLGAAEGNVQAVPYRAQPT